MAFCISEKYVNHHSVCLKLRVGGEMHETVDAGGTFFVHLSGILLPHHKVSYIAHWGGFKNIFTKVCERLWEFYKARLAFG